MEAGVSGIPAPTRRDGARPENEEMVFMPVFMRLEIVSAHLNHFLKQ